MQPVLSRAGRAVRDDRTCRCARSRTSGGRARSSAPSPRDRRWKPPTTLLLFRTATRQICRRMGYFATFMCRPGAQGLLFERLASASVADRRGKSGRNLFMPERERRVACRRSAATFSAGCCSMPPPATAVRDADRQRLSPLPAELARARPRHLVLRPSRRDDARAGRAGRSGDPDGEPDRRAGGQSVSLYRVADRRRPRRHRAASSIRGRRTTSPTAPSGRCCRRACRRRSRRSSSEPLFRAATRRRVHRLFPQAQAQRGRPVRAMAQGGRRADAGDEPTEWEQNEYFDFF